MWCTSKIRQMFAGKRHRARRDNYHRQLLLRQQRSSLRGLFQKARLDAQFIVSQRRQNDLPRAFLGCLVMSSGT